MIDLAPEIHRQRAVLEGYPNEPLRASQIRAYLNGLSVALDMRALTEPVSHRSEKYGEAAWIHWETSGAHFYAWDWPRLFFSVDIYTCKPFDIRDAVRYTTSFFEISTVEHVGFSNVELAATGALGAGNFEACAAVEAAA